MGRINSIGAWFEKIAGGFVFGTQTDKMTIKGTVQVESDGGSYEHTLPSRNGTVALLDDIITDNQFIGQAYAVWSGTGLIFDVIYPAYYIDGVRYPAGTDQITLDVADVTNPRLDVIAIDATGAIKITGVPSADPVQPTVDTVTQIAIATVLVNAGAVTPSEITDQDVYKENTEWTGSSNNGTVNFDAVANPFVGAKHVSCGAFTNAQYIKFVDGSVHSAADYESIKFYIRLKSSFLFPNANIRVKFYNGATLVSNVVTIGAAHNFVKQTINTYQLIVIPLSEFTFSNANFDTVQFDTGGSNSSGFDLDNIVLQTGVVYIEGDQNTVTSIITDSGVANANQPNDTFQFVGANGLLISASGKVLTFTQAAQSAITTTHAALKALKDANNLAPGATYRIPFQTKHKIQDTSPAVIHTGTSENLLLHAINTNTLDRVAISETYPQDLIEYDITNILCEDGVTAREGWITKRFDRSKKVTTFYDYRNVKFRVYKTDLYHHVTVKDSSSQVSSTIIYGQVDAVPTQYREYMLDLTPFVVHDANPTLSLTNVNTVVREIVKPGGISLAANEINSLLGSYKRARVYYSPTYDKYVLEDNQVESDMFKWYMALVPTAIQTLGRSTVTVPNPLDFLDVYTFASQTPTCTDMYIGKNGNLPNRTLWLAEGSSKVHIADGNYDNVHRWGASFIVDIRFDFINNRIASSYQYLRVGTEHYNMLILTSAGQRLCPSTGNYSSDSYCDGSTFLSSTNVYNLSFDHHANCLFRFVSGWPWCENIKLGVPSSCIFNFFGTTKGVDIPGNVINLYFERMGTLMDFSLDHFSEWNTQEEFTVKANVDLNGISTYNKEMYSGYGKWAGVHKIGVWNAAGKQTFNFNPTANRIITVPDKTGLLPLITDVDSLYFGGGNTITPSAQGGNIAVLQGSSILGNWAWSALFGDVNTIQVGAAFNNSMMAGCTGVNIGSPMSGTVIGGNGHVVSGAGGKSHNGIFGASNTYDGTFGGGNNLLIGGYNRIDANTVIVQSTFVGGRRAIGSNSGVFLFGWPIADQATRPSIASGEGSTNISANSSSQGSGHGALANYCAIIGGQDHNIPSDSPRSAIIGGNGIKADAARPDNVYVPKLRVVGGYINATISSTVTPPSTESGIAVLEGSSLLGDWAWSAIFGDLFTINSGKSFNNSMNAGGSSVVIDSHVAGTLVSGGGQVFTGAGAKQNLLVSGNSNTIQGAGLVGNSFVMGGLNVIDAASTVTGIFIGGRRSKATSDHAFVHGFPIADQSTRPVLVSGVHAFNVSANSSSQGSGEGALSDYCAILGGQDHNIPSDSPRAAIIGGNGIKARAADPDQVYVSKFNIMNGDFRIFSIPTASAGLPSGSVWSNAGVLTIV